MSFFVFIKSTFINNCNFHAEVRGILYFTRQSNCKIQFILLMDYDFISAVELGTH